MKLQSDSYDTLLLRLSEKMRFIYSYTLPFISGVHMSRALVQWPILNNEANNKYAWFWSNYLKILWCISVTGRSQLFYLCTDLIMNDW